MAFEDHFKILEDKNNEHQQMKRIAGPLAFDLMRPGGSLRKAKRFFFKAPVTVVAERHAEEFERPPAEANFEYPGEDLRYYQRPDFYRFYNAL